MADQRPDGQPGQHNNPDSSSDRFSDDELTLPNIFGGVSRADEDPDRIVQNLTAHAHGEPVPPATRATPVPPAAGNLPAVPPSAQRWVAAPGPYGGAAGGPQYFGSEPVVTGPAGDGRRRRALAGVLGVIAATVAVVLTALFIAPRWSGSPAPAPQPGPTTVSSPGSTPSSTPATTAIDAAPTVQDSSAPAPSTASATGATTRSRPATTVVTRTVPATGGPGTAPTSGPPRATGVPSTPLPTPTTPKPTPTPTKPKPTPTKPKPTPTKPKPTPTKPAVDTSLGAPRQDIACSNGFVVQLASELTPEAFRSRVAALRSQGLVPSDAKAADSRTSCQIFANQRNTYVLYAGAYSGMYDGCAARIGGPADSFIKGANPSTSGTFISCVCGVGLGGLPQLVSGTDQRGWTGELQRFLAGKLNISVGELGADQWGVYNAGTQAAVKRFQQENRLPQTGTVDKRTWKALQKSGC